MANFQDIAEGSQAGRAAALQLAAAELAAAFRGADEAGPGPGHAPGRSSGSAAEGPNPGDIVQGELAFFLDRARACMPPHGLVPVVLEGNQAYVARVSEVLSGRVRQGYVPMVLWTEASVADVARGDEIYRVPPLPGTASRAPLEALRVTWCRPEEEWRNRANDFVRDFVRVAHGRGRGGGLGAGFAARHAARGKARAAADQRTGTGAGRGTTRGTGAGRGTGRGRADRDEDEPMPQAPVEDQFEAYMARVVEQGNAEQLQAEPATTGLPPVPEEESST